jgi:hypothetical protein
MKSAVCFWGLTLFYVTLLLSGCEKRQPEQVEFTKADSLTDTYLALQDTMLQVWNTMIFDDDRKIRAMYHLLHELTVSNPGNRDKLDHYEERLDALVSMRYDQQSISDPEIVTQYDFASNSLVTELIALAESQTEFAYNTTLQKLVDSIRSADQRVLSYRDEYDKIAIRFNRFVEQNHAFLEDINSDTVVVKKPLFQMAAD